MSDQANHPAHYGGESNVYETIKVIEAWGLNFNRGNALKYLSRAGKKGDPIVDLEKCIWYLNREVEGLRKRLSAGPVSHLTFKDAGHG